MHCASKHRLGERSLPKNQVGRVPWGRPAQASPFLVVHLRQLGNEDRGTVANLSASVLRIARGVDTNPSRRRPICARDRCSCGPRRPDGIPPMQERLGNAAGGMVDTTKYTAPHPASDERLDMPSFDAAWRIEEHDRAASARAHRLTHRTPGISIMERTFSYRTTLASSKGTRHAGFLTAPMEHSG